MEKISCQNIVLISWRNISTSLHILRAPEKSYFATPGPSVMILISISQCSVERRFLSFVVTMFWQENGRSTAGWTGWIRAKLVSLIKLGYCSLWWVTIKPQSRKIHHGISRVQLWLIITWWWVLYICQNSLLRQKSPCLDRKSPSGNSCCWTYPLYKIFRAKIAIKWSVYKLRI